MSSRFEKKHDLIVEAAISVFLESGFSGTSVDKIAEKAGLSKVTVYNHFKDKKELFEKVMEIHCQNLAKNSSPLELGEHFSVQENLRKLSESIVKGLLTESSISLMRVVIFETGQFPELGKSIWAGGLPMLDNFARYLEEETKRGRLKIKNPILAARQFFGMIKENLVWPLLMGLELNTTPQFQKEVIDSSIQLFLAHYEAD